MTATMTDPATVVTPAVFDPLRDELNKYLLYRETEIDLLVLALVARCHIFYLSVPGTGKSMLVREAMQRISDARLFALMPGKFADDSALFGPQSLAGLKEGKRRREFDGYLPTAHLFFADELWKSAEPLLNLLLQALNERVFFDDGVEKPMPLWTMVCASNEPPQQENAELAAIYDRVGLRRIVDAVEDPATIRALLDLPAPPSNPAQVLRWDDVVGAHEAAMKVPVSDDTKSALIDIVLGVKDLGLPVASGRRQREALRIAQAAAWLDGATATTPGHLDFMADYLWELPEQRPDVAKLVYQVASPMRAECLALGDSVAALIVEVDRLSQLDPKDDARKIGTLDLNTKVKRAAHEAAQLEPKVSGRAASDVAVLWGHIVSVHQQVQTVLIGVSEQFVPDIVQQARAGGFVDA